MTPFIARLSRARHMQQYWDALIRGAPEDDLARLRAALDQPTLDLMEGIRTTQVTPAPDLAFLTRMENDVMDAFQRAHAQPVPIRSGITNRWPAQSGLDRTIPGRSLAMPRRRSMAAVAAFATVALVAITLAAFFFSMRGSDQPAFVPGTPVEVPTSTPAPAPTETVAPVTMYRGNLERTGEMPGPAPTDRPGVLWRAETGSVVKGPLAVGNGLVYTGTDDGSVHAFDMATGAAVWKLTGNTTIESPSIVLDGAIAYIAGYDGMVLAVDAATGTELWRTDPALNVSRRVAYDAATKSLYVGGLEAVSYAFDSATGQLKWQTDIQAPQASIASIVTADTLYFGIPDGLLYALNTADGTIRWTYDSTHDGFGSLTYANNTIFGPVGPAEDSAFVAVDATTGAERWQITSESAPYSAAAVVDGNLIIGTDLGDVMSVAQADGQVNWTFATGNASSFGGPASIVDDSVYAVDTGGWLYALDVATGQELWRVKLDEGINYSPAITGGVIYLGTWSGSVYALGTGGTDLDELAATPVAATPRTSAANPDEVKTTFLWQAGGGGSALRRPDGIAAAPDGSIWVIDAVDHEVHILEGDGTTRQVIALDNAGAGSFNFTLPNGESYATIAVDADGNAYVLDNGNFRVVKFDASGQFIQELNYEDLADTAAYADDIAVGPDGSIYVKDSAGRRVLRLSANGELATVIGQPENVDERLAGPAPIGVDAAGNLYVSDNADDIAEVKVYAPDGTFLRRFGQGDLELAIDIAVDANGIAYVTDPPTNQIKMFDGDGELIGAIGEAGTEPGQFTGIGYLAVDANGNLYAVDFEGRQVEAFHLTLNTPAEEASSPAASESTPDTADASIAGVEVLWETTGGEGGFAGPTLLTIAPDGTIWVGDPGHNSFQIFDTDGIFIESWTGTGDGEFGMTEDDGDPFGAVAFAADGSFYVLDPGAREILAFSADRTFLSRFGGQGRGPGQFLQPMSIATDQAGNVAVSDFGRGDIQTFAQDGTLLSTARLQSTYPVGNSMVIDSDGNFIVLEFECCSGPAVVEKFDQEGNLLLQIGLEPGTGQLLGQPLGIGVDAAGNIYVTEIEPSRVLVYSPDGEYLTDFGDALDSTVVFPFPFDVAVDAEGGVYVTEPSRNMLVKLRLPESLFPATPTP